MPACQAIGLGANPLPPLATFDLIEWVDAIRISISPCKPERDMKTVGTVFGILLALVGCVWFFQGIGVLPGSFMSGQRIWAIYGAIAVVMGAALVLASRRAGARKPPQ